MLLLPEKLFLATTEMAFGVAGSETASGVVGASFALHPMLEAEGEPMSAVEVVPRIEEWQVMEEESMSAV